MTTTRRSAIVTGAGRGIGAAIAQRLANDGLAVAVADVAKESCHETVRNIVEQGGQAHAVEVDVADEAAVDAAVADTAANLGPPTVLVNNAGITRDDLLFKMDSKAWDDVLNVHLRGSFLMSRAVQSHMVSAGFGRIVNISSTAALGNRGQTNYSAAKAGVQGLTKTLAIELGRYGVTANAIAPGFVESEMTAATAERLGIGFDELKKTVIDRVPVGRAGTPADIANAASFLCGDDAGYVSGQVLYVAGGPTD